MHIFKEEFYGETLDVVNIDYLRSEKNFDFFQSHLFQQFKVTLRKLRNN